MGGPGLQFLGGGGAATAALNVMDGVRNLADAPYSAPKTGLVDAGAAFRQAITDASADWVASGSNPYRKFGVYVPPGTYLGIPDQAFSRPLGAPTPISGIFKMLDGVHLFATPGTVNIIQPALGKSVTTAAILGPPGSPLLSAGGTGGTLPGGVQQSYVLRGLHSVYGRGLKSGNQIVTPTAGQKVTVTVPGANAGEDAGWEVYRATTIGSEVLVATLPHGTTVWVDDGTAVPGVQNPSTITVTDASSFTATGFIGASQVAVRMSYGSIVGNTFQDVRGNSLGANVIPLGGDVVQSPQTTFMATDFDLAGNKPEAKHWSIDGINFDGQSPWASEQEQYVFCIGPAGYFKITRCNVRRVLGKVYNLLGEIGTPGRGGAAIAPHHFYIGQTEVEQTSSNFISMSSSGATDFTIEDLYGRGHNLAGGAEFNITNIQRNIKRGTYRNIHTIEFGTFDFSGDDMTYDGIHAIAAAGQLGPGIRGVRGHGGMAKAIKVDMKKAAAIGNVVGVSFADGHVKGLAVKGIDIQRQPAAVGLNVNPSSVMCEDIDFDGVTITGPRTRCTVACVLGTDVTLNVEDTTGMIAGQVEAHIGANVVTVTVTAVPNATQLTISTTLADGTLGTIPVGAPVTFKTANGAEADIVINSVKRCTLRAPKTNNSFAINVKSLASRVTISTPHVNRGEVVLDAPECEVQGGFLEGGLGNASVIRSSTKNRVIGTHMKGNATNGITAIAQLRSGTDQMYMGCTYEHASASQRLWSETTGDNNQIVGGRVLATTPNDGLAGASTTVRRVKGYPTEGTVTGTIPSAATTVTVPHGLKKTPSISEVIITPTNNPTNDPGNLYVSAVSATDITVACRTDPGASGATFNATVVKAPA